MEKILFLDIDGVLNSLPTPEVRESWGVDGPTTSMKIFGLDPVLVALLKEILDKTSAKIVFSTSWRYFKDHHMMGPDWRKSLAEMLGISEDIFIGNTPDLNTGGWEGGISRVRGLEINYWLENNPEIAVPGEYRFCVIDDIVADILPVIDNTCVIQTDYRTGLQKKDVETAVRILNGDGLENE